MNEAQRRKQIEGVVGFTAPEFLAERLTILVEDLISDEAAEAQDEIERLRERVVELEGELGQVKCELSDALQNADTPCPVCEARERFGSE